MHRTAVWVGSIGLVVYKAVAFGGSVHKGGARVSRVVLHRRLLGGTLPTRAGFYRRRLLGSKEELWLDVRGARGDVVPGEKIMGRKYAGRPSGCQSGYGSSESVLRSGEGDDGERVGKAADAFRAQGNKRIVPMKMLRKFWTVCVSLLLALPLDWFYTPPMYFEMLRAEKGEKVEGGAKKGKEKRGRMKERSEEVGSGQGLQTSQRPRDQWCGCSVRACKALHKGVR